MKANEAYKQLICLVNCKYGAPMGRADRFPEKREVIDGKEYAYTGRLFNRKLPLDSGGYDKGGAYWGHGSPLRVRFNSDLTFVQFYRQEKQ
jgi:hypothetical protein